MSEYAPQFFGSLDRITPEQLVHKRGEVVGYVLSVAAPEAAQAAAAAQRAITEAETTTHQAA